MYGIINDAIRDMVSTTMGTDVWKELSVGVGLKNPSFNSLEAYDDSITVDLVNAIAEKTKRSAPEILRAFGKYWVEYARKSEYSSILEVYGDGPVELLESLDHLHTRLKVSFGALNPPAFWVTHISENEIIVHYQSDRDMPLEFFVQGLIEGIFNCYNQSCEVEIISATGNEKAAFKVNF